LKIVLYSGGSVKEFATALKLAERGVLAVSARFANSVMVSRYCLAQILLAAKGFFRNTRDCRDSALTTSRETFKGMGTYHTKVALLGMGMIARELVKLLRQVDMEVLAVDPYLSEEEAVKLGVTKVTIEQAFRDAYVVSNHLPNIDSLSGVIDSSLLASMQDGAVFLNTGRGAQVNEDDLAKVARERPDLSFLLDVTEPEPPAAGHPFYTLPNIQLTSHIAGAMGNELQILGDTVISDLRRYCAGQPLRYAEDLTQLDKLG
jgi:phosphoglycerate dehydrogenase-like enzyme